MKSRIFAALLVLVLLSACAPGRAGEKDREGRGPGAGREMKEYRIITATDLHYISPVLTDQGEYFTRLVTYADGKAMPWFQAWKRGCNIASVTAPCPIERLMGWKRRRSAKALPCRRGKVG